MKSSLRWHVGSGALALVGLCFGPIAVAQIEVTPRLQVLQTWTDTANLDVNGTNGDFITTISPGVNISGATARVQTFIDYTLNGLVFWKDSSNSDIRHQLQAAVNTEVIRDRFFVDVRGGIQQQFQNFGGQIVNFQQNFTQNRITVQNYAVNPRWQEEIGSFATATAQYTFRITELEREGDASPVGALSDNIGHSGSFSLKSGPAFQKLRWDWTTRYQSNNRTFNDLRFERASSILDLDYNFSRKLSLLGSVGYEEFSDNTLREDQESVVWDVGFRFTPGPRLSLEGRVGERFGGTVFSASASYRFSQTDTLQASYSEDVNVPNQLGANRFGNVVDLDGDNIPDFDEPIDEILGQDAFLTDAVFQQKSGQLTLARNLRRTSASVNAFWQQRNFAANDFTTEVYGASLGGQYRLDGAQSIAANVTYRNTKFPNRGSDNFIAISPSYTYTISPNLNASARYNFSKRFSNSAALDRTINSISLTFAATF
ncbi:MAG: TIGR03016 family PEP-CTERM system-associated outer membrane protein [Pseudomonadota bacterium]